MSAAAPSRHAGIGGGANCYNGTNTRGTVAIYGGTITATVGSGGAGIGTGKDGQINNIILAGGTIEANGGGDSAQDIGMGGGTSTLNSVMEFDAGGEGFSDDGGEPVLQSVSGSETNYRYDLDIRGGSIYTSGGTEAVTAPDPYNSNYGELDVGNEIVYYAEADFGTGYANQPVSGTITVDDSDYQYSFNGVKTDASGKLHLYTFAGSVVLTANGYTFEGTINAANSTLTRQKSPLGGSISIVGNAQCGEALTVNTASVTPEGAAETLSYTWYRCDSSDGAEATQIAGAAVSTYTLTGDDAGKYIKVVVASTEYSGSLSAVTSQVKENPATVSSAPAAKENLVYNGSAQQLVTGGTASGGTMLYSLDENNNFSADIPTATDAGDYTVYYYVQGDTSHSDTAPASVEVTIAQAQLTITGVTATNRAYDGTDKVAITAVTLGGIKNSDDVSVDASTLTGTVESANAGTYSEVTLTGTAALTGAKKDNYTLTLPAGGVTVTSVNDGSGVSISKVKSTISIKDTYSLNYTYNGQPLANPTSGQLTITGADYNDVTFTWYKGPVDEGNKLTSAPKDAGSYYLVASIPDSGNTSGSQATSAAITINPAVISINSATVADKTYDGKTDATVTGVSFTGLVTGESLTSGDGYTATAEFDSKDAGISQSATVTVTLSNGNYTFAENKKEATFNTNAEIAQRSVTLSWSETSFTYDGTPKTVTATVTNKVGDDTFALTYEGNTEKDVGNYTAKVTGLGNDNYTLTGASGTEQAWSIGVASIAGAEVTLSPESFTYDGSEQKPTVTVTLGEEELTEDTDYTVSYSGNCVDADTYTVTVTGKGNYSGTAASKTYTIEKATVTPSISGTAS